jgi:hypothetical protein
MHSCPHRSWVVQVGLSQNGVKICTHIHSVYHIYCLFTNTTTVEGWEKDKVTRLVRRGKISEVKFPYVSCLSTSVSISQIRSEHRYHWQFHLRVWKQPALLVLALKAHNL